MDESRLIQRAAQGEPAAWEPIMLAHQEPVFRFAYLLLGDPDDAEDITQETFLRAYHHLGRFDTSRPLRPWLLSITAHLSHNWRRSAGRYLNAISRAFHFDTQTGPNIVERSELDQAANQLWIAVRRLSTDDQHVIYLRFFLDLSVAEAAQALDVAEGTVKSRLNRALGRLRAIIKSDFPMLSEGYEV